MEIFFFIKDLFIFDCAGSLLMHVRFIQLQRAGATLLVEVRRLLLVVAFVAEHGFRARGLGGWHSMALEHRLSSYGARAQLLHGMGDLPGSGTKPMCPALADGFFTTEPPVQPWNRIFFLFPKKKW